MTASSSEIVMVPVPREHLEATYAFLAARTSGRVRADPSGEGVEVEGQGIWTPDMVAKLKDGSLHLPQLRQLIDAVADVAPQEISMREVIREIEVSSDKMRGQISGLTKLSNRLFQRRTWPFSVRYGADEGGTDNEPAGSGVAYYRMPVDVAQWWKS